MLILFLCSVLYLVPGEVVLGSPMSVRPENQLRWDLGPEQIQQLADELMGNTKKVYDRVGELDLEAVTMENTLKALADVEVEYTGERCSSCMPTSCPRVTDFLFDETERSESTNRRHINYKIFESIF